MAWLQLKGEQLSGSAYYFNGCKALMFSSVVHFNQATRQLSTWVKATVSSIGSKDRGPSYPALPSPSLPYETSWAPTKNKLNSAAVRESQTWPGKKKRRTRKKNYSKMPSFTGVRERKDRCLISFSVRATGLRGVDLWGGGRLLMFAFCQSVCVCAEKYFRLLFFSNRGERN